MLSSSCPLNVPLTIWDRANVEGHMEFPGLVEQAKIYVPRLKKAGADIVVVAAHSGMDTSSSYGDALPVPENAASLVAEQVPDIDAILVGHAHLDRQREAKRVDLPPQVEVARRELVVRLVRPPLAPVNW